MSMVAMTDGLQRLCNKFYGLIPRRQPTAEQGRKTRIVAHRGAWNLSDRLENTLPAFRECLKHNIWGVEFDLRWTGDNIPILHHDPCTSRVFQTPSQISEQSFADLRRRWPQIPCLQEVVQEFQGKLHLMIELKTKPSEQQEKKLQEVLSALKPRQDFHFMSLQVNYFQGLSSFPNNSFVSIGRGNMAAIYRETLQLGLGGCTGHYLLFSQRMQKKCRQENISVGTGFPDSENLLYREIHRGVDWVFSDRAVQLAKYL